MLTGVDRSSSTTMETSENGADGDVKGRSEVFQFKTEEVSTRPEEMIMADSILKSLSPLINIMRAFGLYFTRGSHVVQESTSPPVHRRIRGCSNWNAGRLYATIMLAMIWLNAARLGVVFHGTETVGAVLFVKIASLPGALLVAVLHTAYYVASHTGSLDRVFCQANFSVAEFSLNYSRRAKVVTVVCGIMITLNLVKEVYSFNLNANDLLPSLLINSFQIPKPYVDIVQVVIVILNLMAVVSWAFPQGMNYLVMTFLYDQFNKLSKEFTKCIGDRGEFSGNFEQLRRRHQAISRSVQEADRFLMISNVACFCCQTVGIILVLYITVFYRDDTISQNMEGAVFYIVWLAFNLFGLTLATGLAIIVNHAVSLCHNCNIHCCTLWSDETVITLIIKNVTWHMSHVIVVLC